MYRVRLTRTVRHRSWITFLWHFSVPFCPALLRHRWPCTLCGVLIVPVIEVVNHCYLSRDDAGSAEVAVNEKNRHRIYGGRVNAGERERQHWRKRDEIEKGRRKIHSRLISFETPFAISSFFLFLNREEKDASIECLTKSLTIPHLTYEKSNF